jgi:hypothetical protein
VHIVDVENRLNGIGHPSQGTAPVLVGERVPITFDAVDDAPLGHRRV